LGALDKCVVRSVAVAGRARPHQKAAFMLASIMIIEYFHIVYLVK
jgi:hypothetical protein